MNRLARAPLVFVGHGSPMNAIEDNSYSRMWEAVGAKLAKAKPKAIVVFSAHWTTSGTRVTSQSEHKLIYDFVGFPEELYEVKYPAKGEPQLAARIGELVPEVEQDMEWGPDHGAWSVLLRMFPKADVPVLQLSLDLATSTQELFAMVAKLKILREEGVMFLGSGNIVHNLRQARASGNPYNWAIDFDRIVTDSLENGDYEALIEYQNLGKMAGLAVPTPEHYLPLIMTLALAEEGELPEFFNEGFFASSVSMRSFVMKG